MNKLSVILSGLGFVIASFLFCTSPANARANEILMGFAVVIFIPVLISHGKFRLNPIDVFGGCRAWAILVFFLLLALSIYTQLQPNSPGGVLASSVPAVFWGLGCAAYSAP